MKRIIIICEGQTEREFCEKVLSHYLLQYEITIQAPLIKKSRGGIVKWDILKKEISNHLREPKTLVTTFIDYYGLTPALNFPRWNESQANPNKIARLEFLENAMKLDIDEAIRYRFIPYIQMHEFEGLLFNNLQIFQNHISKNDLIGENELIQTLNDFPNPELINDMKESSPSHRLARIINGYNKVLYGHYLAEAIGIDRMLEKAPRFNQWVQSLISS